MPSISETTGFLTPQKGDFRYPSIATSSIFLWVCCFVLFFQSDNNELTGISDVQSPQAVPAGGKRKKMGFECGLSSQIAVLQ